MITVIDEKTVLVEPGEPDPDDVLEYAELLIDVEGWNDFAKTRTESSPEQGWTLHDSIGEANRRLFGETPRSSGKDGISLTAGGTTRTEATSKLQKVLGRKTDTEFNDRATSPDQIITVLRKARNA